MPTRAKIAVPIPMFKSPVSMPNGLQATEEGLLVIGQGDDVAALLDYDTGAAIREFQTETDRSSGITVDPDGHFVIASTHNAKLYWVEDETGRTIAKRETPGAGAVTYAAAVGDEAVAEDAVTGAHGLEWDGGKDQLVVAAPPAQRIYWIDPADWVASGEVAHEVKTPGSRPHGIAWGDSENTTLWVADTEAGNVSLVDCETGLVRDVFQVPPTIEVHGLTIWDGVFWYADAEAENAERGKVEDRNIGILRIPGLS